MSALLQQMRADSPAALWLGKGSVANSTALLADLSGNARDLQDAGGGTGPAGSATPIIPGYVGGGCIDWASATNNQYVADAAWNSLTTAYTLEGWFLFTTVGSQQGLIEKYDGSSDGGYIMRLTSSGLINATPVTSGVATDYLASTALSTGRPYHIVYTVASSTTGTIYIDGAQNATKTHSAGGADGDARVDIGARSGDQTFRFSGKMSHVAIYPTALSADRVASHYQAGIRSGVSF